LDRRNRILIFAALAVASISVTGCKKKIAPPPPAAVVAPPVVVAPSPTAHIDASPTSVTAGDPVVLNWSTTNATVASIDGIGTVPTSGTRTVTPSASTTYRLVARNDRETAAASVRVTVNPRAAVAPVNNMSAEEEFRANVQDIFFDYDKYTIRSEGQTALAQDASYFNSHPNIKIVIGGYADERGSAEYNIALGQNRAAAAKKVLVDAGVPAARLRIISYGKEKPFCTEANEACWQKNRRAGFAIDR
jgi:peptidoglycan-associated lipoprotein